MFIMEFDTENDAFRNGPDSDRIAIQEILEDVARRVGEGAPFPMYIKDENGNRIGKVTYIVE